MLEILSNRAFVQENALIDQVDRLDRFRSNRLAVKVNLSMLAAAYRRDDYIRVAQESFAAQVKGLDGHLFILSCSDIVFITRRESRQAIQTAIDRLHVLFSGDPMVQFAHKKNNDDFCVIYDLETNYDALSKAANEYLRVAEQLVPEQNSKSQKATVCTPIKPELLGKLEASLLKTDVSNVVRRQMVCSLFDDKTPQPLFEEIYVSIDDLQNIATPGTDLLSNRWLFQYLTSTLDKRVLALLVRDGLSGTHPYSLNLNVSTVLSPEFMRFIETLHPKMRGRLVVEMNKIDVFSDMGAFMFARDFLRDHGFRVCLDGLTHHTLAYYDRARLGFDLFKVYWTPDSIDNMTEDMLPTLKNVVMEAGQARTILCRCESPRSIEIGQRLGIVMFQGRYVQDLLNAGKSPTVIPVYNPDTKTAPPLLKADPYLRVQPIEYK